MFFASTHSKKAPPAGKQSRFQPLGHQVGLRAPRASSKEKIMTFVKYTTRTVLTLVLLGGAATLPVMAQVGASESASGSASADTATPSSAAATGAAAAKGVGAAASTTTSGVASTDSKADAVENNAQATINSYPRAGDTNINAGVNANRGAASAGMGMGAGGAGASAGVGATP
jgi:hypothetical protein